MTRGNIRCPYPVSLLAEGGKFDLAVALYTGVRRKSHLVGGGKIIHDLTAKQLAVIGADQLDTQFVRYRLGISKALGPGGVFRPQVEPQQAACDLIPLLQQQRRSSSAVYASAHSYQYLLPCHKPLLLSVLIHKFLCERLLGQGIGQFQQNGIESPGRVHDKGTQLLLLRLLVGQ